MQEGSAAQRLAVGQRLGALGGVENQLDSAVFDGVDDVWPAFRGLEDALRRQPPLGQEPLGAGGPDRLEAEAGAGVAFTVKRVGARVRAGSNMRSLSSSRTETNTVPSRGRRAPPPSWLLTNAISNERSIPITSPVDFISGPSTVSTFSPKRANG